MTDSFCSLLSLAQVPYEAYGPFAGGHMQHMGGFRHGGYPYMMHSMHNQGRGG